MIQMTGENVINDYMAEMGAMKMMLIKFLWSFQMRSSDGLYASVDFSVS